MLVDWGSVLTEDESLEFLRTVSLSHALRGGPVGAEIASLIRAKNYPALVKFQISYDQEWNIQHLLDVRQALAFWTKLDFLNLGINTEEVAYTKFLECQTKCGETNKVFRLHRSTGTAIPWDDMQTIESARRKIQSVLGECPSVGELKLRFGPGSTSTITKGSANPQHKFAETPKCSTELYASGLLPQIVRSLPHWLYSHGHSDFTDLEYWECTVVPFELTPGQLQFVPKNALTKRSIVTQPTVDTVLQAGIGTWMSDRLNARGLGTRDQSKNQRLAREGSMTRELATLDLSSASDTISRELVRTLLPQKWFDLLQSCCVRTVTYNDVPLDIQMFSSMGNGFTFPLETLIFWALTSSSCEEGSIVSVYGDDIICPVKDVDKVVRTLSVCGFTVNRDKSYASGPFRESCGADYFDGINIRPYYQKSLVDGASLFNLHNYYTRQFQDEMAAIVLEYIPQEVRLFGPDGYGDGHLIDNNYSDGFRTRKSQRSGWSGCFFETYQDIGKKLVNIYPGDYVSPLYTVYTRYLESQDYEPWLNRRRLSPQAIFRILGTRPFIMDGTPVEFEKPWRQFENASRPLWPVPGVEGYKKVLIYTLSR